MGIGERGYAMTFHDRTVMPPEETEALTKMVAAFRDEGKAALVGPDDVRWDLPAEAYRVLKEVLQAMAKGLAITVVPQHTMLTTQEAADMLGISRPTLVKLLESGEIPFEPRGRHRRVLLTDVLDYQERARVERKKQLTAMVDEAGEHDLYAATATPRPTR
ncbi:MAG: binding domain protein excisionase family [Pseudonocardia sp.]|nr:binding domain protein excisionase family [Pseudonocardia sp.]